MIFCGIHVSLNFSSLLGPHFIEHEITPRNLPIFRYAWNLIAYFYHSDSRSHFFSPMSREIKKRVIILDWIFLRYVLLVRFPRFQLIVDIQEIHNNTGYFTIYLALYFTTATATNNNISETLLIIYTLILQTHK